MRYVTIFLVTLISSCSWSWPWGASKTGNCLDDGNCQGANPFEEKLKGGTWHCYGVSKEEPWDCDQEQDDTKISAIEDAPQRRNSPELMDSPELANSPELMDSAELIDSSELADSPQPAVDNEGDTEQNDRAAMDLADTIPNSDEISSGKPGMEASNPQVMTAEVLSGYNNTSFAIQLIALQTLEEAIQYTEKLNLDQPIYVKIRSQNSDWHVVLLGIYETRSEADAVSEQWTSSHGLSSRPWVRPLHPLKKAANLVVP
ncbi:SPOR domain-containing protein [Gammaproteobacteria bacterium]|nr:SPOR domain-containing protein [Gammaproteobacteria bacterium]